MEQDQPQKIYRCRNASEEKHGHIHGQKKDYPSLKFPVPPKYAKQNKIKCLVSLYERPSNDKDPFKLSQYTLWTNYVIEEGEIQYEPYIKLLEVKDSKCEIKVEKCYISRVKKDSIEASLQSKYEKLKNLRLLTDRDLNEEQQERQQYTKHSKQICLGYIFFTKENQYIDGPILSESIIDGEVVDISRIIQAYGPIEGGNEVALLVKNISKKSLEKVRVYKTNEDHSTAGETFIEKKSITIHKNSVIYFIMPKYKLLLNDSEALKNDQSLDNSGTCYVQIESNGGLQSKPVKYVYQKHNLKRPSSSDTQNEPMKIDAPTSSPPKKLLNSGKEGYDTDAIQITESDNSHEPIAKENNKTPVTEKVLEIKKITEESKSSIKEKLEKICMITRHRSENGNTIYHDALKEDSDFLKLKCLYKNFAVLLREAINDDNQNLLHYACDLKQYYHLRALIGLSCSIYAVDNDHNTPLHIAIERKHLDGITKFSEIIKDPEAYPELEADIERLLGVHNRFGYTVLHLAVINDMRDLVAAILTFCKNQKLDACYMQVLGSGDTIMHLAVTENLHDMAKLIAKHRPDAGHYMNYAKITAYDLCEQLDENAKQKMIDMFEEIQIQ